LKSIVLIKTKSAIQLEHYHNPYFSVIIPTFNRKKTLTKALDSLLNQSERNWEAIIVDDGSTDGTEAYILPYLIKDNRIKYFIQTNKGAALAKNNGIKEASGKFITFLDSDDVYEAFHLKSRYEILKNNPTVMFLYGGVKIIGNQFVPDRNNNAANIHIDNCVIGGAFFVEKELLLSLNGFKNILIGEDAELFDRICITEAIKLEVETPSYIYQRHLQDSVTTNFMNKKT